MLVSDLHWKRNILQERVKLTIKALHPKRTHGGSNQDVSNRWLESHISFPNFRTCILFAIFVRPWYLLCSIPLGSLNTLLYASSACLNVRMRLGEKSSFLVHFLPRRLAISLVFDFLKRQDDKGWQLSEILKLVCVWC